MYYILAVLLLIASLYVGKRWGLPALQESTKYRSNPKEDNRHLSRYVFDENQSKDRIFIGNDDLFSRNFQFRILAKSLNEMETKVVHDVFSKDGILTVKRFTPIKAQTGPTEPPRKDIFSSQKNRRLN